MRDMIAQVNEALQSVFGEVARRLARERDAVQRETTLTGADLARILVFGWVSDPQISRQGLARLAGRLGVGVSGSAIQQRLSKKTALFLQ